MFGFGKKKISAHKFAEISVPLSITMASSFVDAWNSKRHHYDIHALERDDQSLFEAFALYNTLMHDSRHIVDLENPQTKQMFLGLVAYMYWQFSIDCGVAPPIGPQYAFGTHSQLVVQVISEYSEYSSDSANRRADAFEELLVFICRKLNGVKNKKIDFALELATILGPLHKEGWEIMKQRNERLLMNDETLDFFIRLKKTIDAQ